MALIPKNDNGCGWLNILPKRLARRSFSGRQKTKWLIIGAGNSGLSAALTLAKELPDEDIMLIDAGLAGEGASARNSGYLIASTLNDGHMSDNGLAVYKNKFALNKLSVEVARSIAKEHGIECGWNECGKYHVSAGIENKQKLETYRKLLDEINVGNEFLNSDQLQTQLGTSFYKMGVKTDEGILIQPAAFSRGMIDALPKNVKLYENSPVLNMEHGKTHKITCEDGEILAENLIVAVNGYMPGLGIKKNRVFPLLLTASMTRSLNAEEQDMMGDVHEWGLLSANPMGATLRYTSDHRFMIRNTVEVSSSLQISKNDMMRRKNVHIEGLMKRFPFLSEDCVEHSWAGITCISSNNANIFEKVSDNHFVIGCYNGGGVGLSTLFGQEIALRALDKKTAPSKIIAARPKAKWLPPQPFLNWGVKLKLAKDRLKALNEI